MTTLVNTNKLTWFQDEGEPLKNGYIYVGEVQQDPRSFPKTVTFTDSDGNAFTAAQPLRTDENGRIQWNGVAITATVDGDYSLLILNSNKTQIDDGYIASVTDYNAGSGSGSVDDYRQYALTLADVKQLDKTPGQTVGNIGKVAATDNLGSDWLVVSNTGNPADDIDLIDFDNGTQGQRIKSFTEEAVTAQDKQDVRDNIDVFSKAETIEKANNLSDLADIPTARANLDVYSKAETVSTIQTRLGTRTSVFAGSATSFDLDTAGGGYPGDGFYNVAYDNGISTVETVIFCSTGDNKVAGETDGTYWDLIRCNTGKVVTVTRYGAGAGALSITGIQKIG